MISNYLKWRFSQLQKHPAGLCRFSENNVKLAMTLNVIDGPLKVINIIREGFGTIDTQACLLIKRKNLD